MIGVRRSFLLLLCCLAAVGVSSNSDLVPYTRAYYDTEQVRLSYITRAGQGQDIVLFIHGTPGNAEVFSEYLSKDWLLTSAVQLVSIDRPAWGYSQVKKPSQPVLTLAQQSRVIGEFISLLKQQFPASKLIVVGHSLGGSLVAQLLVDHASSIDAGLLLAASVDPRLAKPRWYHRWAKNGFIKRLIGSELAQSNLEMLALENDLALLDAAYLTMLRPVTVIQGLKDRLVDPENTAYLSAVWPQATIIKLPRSGHFLPWQQQPLIVEHIVRLQQKLKSVP